MNNNVHVVKDGGNNDNETDFDNGVSHNSEGNNDQHNCKKDSNEISGNKDKNYSCVQLVQLSPSIDDIYHKGNHYAPVALNSRRRVRVAVMSAGPSRST